MERFASTFLWCFVVMVLLWYKHPDGTPSIAYSLARIAENYAKPIQYLPGNRK